MSPIRKTIVLLIATLMIAGGAWLLYEQFTVSTRISVLALLTGSALVSVGFFLLWEDFIAPHRSGDFASTDATALEAEIELLRQATRL